MVQVKGKKLKKLAPLFDGMTDTLILSCLQGLMGTAYADSADHPTAAKLVLGSFGFVAGDCASPEAAALIAALPENYTDAKHVIYPQNEDWQQKIQALHSECEISIRYAIKKEPEAFDRDQLQACLSLLPQGLTLCPIGREEYEILRADPWGKVFCEQFASAEDFLQHGMGFVVKDGQVIVSGCSSYSYYNGGIEIEVSTRETHRRQHLAQICASQVILACQSKGLYPSWDAANLMSVALAQRLGYHFEREYPVCVIDRPQRHYTCTAEICPCTLDDCADIQYINDAALGYAFAPEQTRLRLQAVLQRPTDRIFVARVQGRAVGYLHAADYECLYAPSLKNIMAIAVLAPYRGNGIGRMLLHAAEDWAKSCGCAGIRLVSSKSRTGAHEFYLHCGYTLRKVQKNFIKYL